MQKNLAILFAVAVLAVGFATPAYAAPKDACTPWPECKDDAQEPGQSTCNSEYLDIIESPTASPAIGPCTDMQGDACVLVRFTDDTPGWRFTEDCKTSATLIIKPDDRLLDGDDRHMLELVGPWSGSRAAITNSGGQAVVRNLTIDVVDSTVANGSCDVGGSPVQAAISFDPHLGTGGVPGTRAQNVKITVAGGAQFCNAIELESATTTNDNPVRSAGVTGSEIGLESYSNFGIFVTNINITDSSDTKFNVVAISHNRVHSSRNGCVAIRVGPLIERADIEDNDIDVPGGCGGSDGVGISVLTTGVANGTFATPRPADIVGNIVDIDGDSDVGISIEESAIGTNEGNAITGAGAPVGVPYCVDNSEVPFPTKGKKKNTFNGDLITADSVMTCPVFGF